MRSRNIMQLMRSCIVLLLIHSSPVLGQWEEKAALPDNKVTCAVAIDSQTCFLTVPGAGAGFPGHPLYITRNGGASWETLVDSVISIDAVDPAFITVLRVHSYWGKEYFRVIQSSDTGRTWKVMTTFRYSSLNGGWGEVYAYSQNRAFIYYNDRFVTVRARDSIPANAKLKFQVTGCFRRGRIFWFPAETGIWRSDDDGTSLDRALDGQDVADFFPLNEHTAWVLTKDYNLYRTDDAGGNWSAIPSPRNRRYDDPRPFYEGYAAVYAPGDTTQQPWLRLVETHFTRNDDGTWDNLSLPPGQSERFQSISRCADGSAWATSAESVYRAVGTPHHAQGLSVLDLSSKDVKRANVILPAIGWESWRRAIVERAEAGGEFKVLGKVQSPKSFFTDESCLSSGPFRYRVTFDPPAGKYTQIESGPVSLDRDSVLILDLLEYVRIPEGMTLHYTNGMSMYCSYDSTTMYYTFHRQFPDRDTTDVFLAVHQDPQLSLEEFGLTYGRLINGSETEIYDWKSGITRFLVTTLPPELRVDTITVKDREAGSVFFTYSAVLVRNLGIAQMILDWYVPRTGNSGRDLIELSHAVGVAGIPNLPSNANIRAVFPNPAKDAATMRVDIEQAGPVSLALYDVFGRKVSTVFEGTLEAGAYDYPMSIPVLPKGVYFVVLRSGGLSYTKKLLLRW